IRTHIDWVGHVESASDEDVLAVVLPEAAPGDGPKIKERLRTALVKSGRDEPLRLDFGLVGLERERGCDTRTIEAAALLQVAEHCRRCTGRAGPAQLSAVQRSVAVGVTIA